MISNKIREIIRDTIVDSIRRRTDTAFRESQYRVPVITGKLKRSGTFSAIDSGANIIYWADYSSFVEHGIKGGIQKVRGFYRRGGSYVKSFSRYMPKREGRHFIESSLKDSFKELNSEFENQVRLRGFKIIRGT